MKIEEVEGIVLSETNYSESSKILHILTEEYGLIGVISKGCRNMKSKLRSVSSKLTYGYFYISKKDELSILIEVDIIDDLKNIKLASDNISPNLQEYQSNTRIYIFENENKDKNF